MKPYTQAELEDFKAKYPRVVREIEVYPSGTTFDKDGTPSEEPACFLVKKPSKSLLSLITSKEYKDAPEKINEAVVKNCVLVGDTELMENDASIYMGLVTELSTMIETAKVALKKV